MLEPVAKFWSQQKKKKKPHENWHNGTQHEIFRVLVQISEGVWVKLVVIQNLDKVYLIQIQAMSNMVVVS